MSSNFWCDAQKFPRILHFQAKTFQQGMCQGAKENRPPAIWRGHIPKGDGSDIDQARRGLTRCMLEFALLLCKAAMFGANPVKYLKEMHHE
jgi:hypothetical protein